MYRTILPALLAIFLSGCQQQPESAGPIESGAAETRPLAQDSFEQSAPGDEQSWENFVDGYIEASLVAHPAWAVYQGRHEFDGRLPDWSRAGIQAEIRRLKQARADADAYTDDQLGDEQQFQREYFIARLDHDLFWMEKAGWPFRNPMHYLGWMSDSLDPSPYLTLDYAPANERMQAFTRYLENIPTAAEQIRANLAMPMPAPWLQFGIDAFEGYARYFAEDVPAVWADVEDEKLHQRFRAANRKAVSAMQALAGWMDSHRGTATDDYALGPELYRRMLWNTERVDTPLTELEAIARADLARNQKALDDACKTFAPRADIRECFARMAANKPEGGPVAGARRQLVETRAFLEQADLVTIPGTEKALVAEARRMRDPTRPTSTFPAPGRRTSPASTTSPRRIRNGRPRSRPPISPAKPTCWRPPFTKCGRATS